MSRFTSRKEQTPAYAALDALARAAAEAAGRALPFELALAEAVEDSPATPDH